MSEYTIIEPHVEFFEPPNESNYLQFLERCTRICYKSEDLIKEGSAEKLMTKVVKEYEHYSVTEHANCILEIEDRDGISNQYLSRKLFSLNPLLRISWRNNNSGGTYLIISGNIRMWVETFQRTRILSDLIWGKMETALHCKMPFFFDKCFETLSNKIQVIDENPLTNKNNLTIDEMKKHMTLTFKFVGDRTMSHQLVRHRLFAFSQESQRYCNYGKKGFQFVIPPTADNTPISENKGAPTKRELFTSHALNSYQAYLHMLKKGLPPEDARGLLPNCTKTEVVTTGTLGYWIDHVIPHRGHNPKAQWQIRKCVLEVEAVLKEKLPHLF